MSYIYDKFPTRRDAEKFRDAVRAAGKRADVWDTQDAMHEASNEEFQVAVAAMNKGEESPLLNGTYDGPVSDLFPFELTPPIVCVERPAEGEDDYDDLVAQFGGRFAGT